MKYRYYVYVKEDNKREFVDSFKTKEEAELKIKQFEEHRDKLVEERNDSYSDLFKYLTWEIVDMGA